MATGIVKMFDEKKGFGFITPTDGGKDLYVHSTAIEAGSSGLLKEGVRVEFTPGEGPKGPLARDVRTVPTDAPKAPEPNKA